MPRAIDLPDDNTRDGEGFRLPDHSYGEQGLVDGLSESDWETIRRLAYDDRDERSV